jgi:REP element-mobilizing transposase RayT
MPRRPRSLLPETGFFHLVTRGAGGIRIYRDADDARVFLALLGRVARRGRWAIDAFCLMGTHYHLVCRGWRDDISTAEHRLNGRYAQLFNDRHVRHGHLFGDRFSARLIESEEHLHAAIAYVLDNPVRARLCRRSEDYPWSGSRYGKTVD